MVKSFSIDIMHQTTEDDERTQHSAVKGYIRWEVVKNNSDWWQQLFRDGKKKHFFWNNELLSNSQYDQECDDIV